jgi:prolipoprotein diacylglyceryltransferase
MKDPLSYRPAPETQEDIYRSMLFERARKFLTLKDVIVLACIVACAYVVSANFGETTAWGKLTVDSPHGQTYCSDEELRYMHAGRDACFDPSKLHHTDSGREPSLKKITST